MDNISRTSNWLGLCWRGLEANLLSGRNIICTGYDCRKCDQCLSLKVLFSTGFSHLESSCQSTCNQPQSTVWAFEEELKCAKRSIGFTPGGRTKTEILYRHWCGVSTGEYCCKEQWLTPGGGTPIYSFGWGCAAGFAKVLPFTRPNFAILWPYTRLKMLSCSWLQSFVSDPVKWDPILDQFSMITRPYTRPNGLKTIPFSAAHTRIANMWEYHPSPPVNMFKLGWSCVLYI